MSRLKPEFLLRTKAYASAIIRLFVLLPKEREEVRVLGRQMLRAGTSVAAQVREANRGRSRAEFVAKLGGALQEADETMLWLELFTGGLCHRISIRLGFGIGIIGIGWYPDHNYQPFAG